MQPGRAQQSSRGGGQRSRRPADLCPSSGPAARHARQSGWPRAPAYLNYPRNPNRTFQQPIGSGEEITAVTYTTQAPPTPVDQNPAWQRVNQEIGVKVNLPLTQLADYPTKLNTIIAGGSLPDLLSLGAGNGLGIANLPEFLQSQCTDLTPLVSGDAVKAYPNLANLPPYAWRNAVFNNRIYAVPSVRASISAAILFGKGKLLDPRGRHQLQGLHGFSQGDAAAHQRRARSGASAPLQAHQPMASRVC